MKAMNLARNALETTLDIAKCLIKFNSVSSSSNEPISRWVSDRLVQLGFEIEWLPYLDPAGCLKVNIIAKRAPTKSPSADTFTTERSTAKRSTSEVGQGGVCYLAHTDVVPADDWSLDFCGPFNPVVRDDRLWGRGACDMKGSLACALAAIASIPVDEQTHPIYFIVTADEEVGMEGAKHVDANSRFFEEMVRTNVVGVVGEPTELKVVYAHKGGASMRILAHGKSAHSSTRDGINANHQLIPILPLLLELRNECETNPKLHNLDFDPPTLSWNIVLRNEPFATNVTPSLAEADVFLRSMPGVDDEPLIERVHAAAMQLGLEFSKRRGLPFSVPKNAPHILEMLRITDTVEPYTVCYATDAGVLQRLSQLVVCGPGSIEQAHRSDEYISLDQLDRGTAHYQKVFRRWATMGD